MRDTTIRSYGPGKFNTIVDSYVYDLAGNGCDEEGGDVQENGTWYGLMRDTFKLEGPFVDFTPEQLANMTQAERELLTTTAGVIISEDDQGFVTVEYFDTAEQLEAAWSEVEAELSEDDHS